MLKTSSSLSTLCTEDPPARENPEPYGCHFQPRCLAAVAMRMLLPRARDFLRLRLSADHAPPHHCGAGTGYPAG
jgi:hypothetical protein